MKDRVVGVLALTRLGGEDFEREDLELATIFAGHCSAAIENARLYAELQQMVEELRTTQDQLVQSAKLNALGEMAGGVAHDFNNILSAILGRTQLLLREGVDGSTREALTVIERTALDGAHTVKRIQDFTRVRHDQSSESVCLNKVLLEVVDVTRSSWQSSANFRGGVIGVETDLAARRPVSGSAAELREVFTNLLLNAVDALPRGGVIRVSTTDEGDRVVARVSDNGIGMDEETRTRAFDPFFTTKREKGTGLGLSVAYGILRRHHADIRVESRLGDGATFVIRFPAGVTAPAAPAPRPEVPESPRSLRVLCVDDEEEVLDVMCDLVEALGHHVERARTGAEAIAMAKQLAPEIVFSDLGMPDVSGWDVAAGVKKARPETRVALVTGWGAQLERETARQRGVDWILAKPFTLEEVGRVLSQAADLREGKAAA
jgi:signal transduction histidine kinase/CheY-like chemotaxis protein